MYKVRTVAKAAIWTSGALSILMLFEYIPKTWLDVDIFLLSGGIVAWSVATWWIKRYGYYE